MGSCDGPIVRINGRVGWSCAENLMAGKVVIEKNAGSCFVLSFPLSSFSPVFTE